MAYHFGGIPSSHSVNKIKVTEMACSVKGLQIIATLLRAGLSIDHNALICFRKCIGDDQFCGCIGSGLMLKD